MTVNFGTSAHATAVTSLAPSRAIPPASYSLPTMKPVMFCRKTSGTFRLHVGTAQLLGAHLLAGRGLHQRRAADEDRARALDDDRLVAHGGHVRAAGGAGTHHRRDLRDGLRREPRLVVEDPAEVVAVREDLGLQRQKGAARVDEVNARQVVLLGDLLG